MDKIWQNYNHVVIERPLDRSPGAIHVVFVYRRLKTSCINHDAVKGNDSEPDIPT